MDDVIPPVIPLAIDCQKLRVRFNCPVCQANHIITLNTLSWAHVLRTIRRKCPDLSSGPAFDIKLWLDTNHEITAPNARLPEVEPKSWVVSACINV